MNVVDVGTGPPLILVPGIQGRWEYMRPAVAALSAHFRVLTFSLSGERDSGRDYDSARGFDDFADQLEAVLDARGISSAIVCGVSFGGLIALRFAARRPDRTLALVLASTPGPGWHLRRRHDVYTRLPWIFGPVFLAEAPWRLRDELHAALPDRADRRRFARAQLRTFLEAPLSVSRMAARARLIAQLDAAAECARITSRTLVLTGEPGLDHVLASTEASAYDSQIAGARAVVLEGTGHLGVVTKPGVFAARVKEFVDEVLSGIGACRSATRNEDAHDAA
jgi:pimeloyl-ACP methyl ester carboxylesterase